MIDKPKLPPEDWKLIRAALRISVDEGWTVQDYVDYVCDHLSDPAAVPAEFLQRYYHYETSKRSTQRELREQWEMRDSFPYVMIVNPGAGEEVGEVCRAMAGRVWFIEDSGWWPYAPPHGLTCTCSVEAMTVTGLRQEGCRVAQGTPVGAAGQPLSNKGCCRFTPPKEPKRVEITPRGQLSSSPPEQPKVIVKPAREGCFLQTCNAGCAVFWVIVGLIVLVAMLGQCGFYD